jgi:DNA-binding CsgD family transcriptional regulator
MEPGSSSAALLSAIDACYQAALDPSAWPLAVRHTAAALEARACAIGVHAVAGRSGRYLWHAGLADGFAARYARDFAALDPWALALGRMRATGAPQTGADLVPDAELVASRFHKDWLRPQDLHHWCGAVLARDDEELVCLHAMRPQAKGPFGPEPRRQLTLLVPHLQRARTLAGLLEARARRDLSPLDRLLDLDGGRCDGDREHRNAKLRPEMVGADDGPPTSPIDPRMLQARFDLTTAEARVAGLLAAGHSVAGIGDKLGIGVNTVRTHLQRAFAKTGTRRQSELVALVLRPDHVRAL